MGILETTQEIKTLLQHTRRIAVLGIKTEMQVGQPAFSVPQYMQAQGFEIIPVPVYYPEAEIILGQKVYRRVSDIPGDIDMVNIFRRPQDLMPHLDDILAKRPKSVWLQLGISHDEFAKALTDAGIDVVQDRCLLVEHRMLD